MDEPRYPGASASTSRNWAAIAALVLLLSLGIFLRLPYGLFSANQPLHALKPLHPTPKLTELGFDEGLYCGYVGTLNSVGLSNYPRIVDHYITLQKKMARSILPPMRFLYIFTAHLSHVVFGTEPLAALRGVASLFSVLVLILSGLMAWRMKGPVYGLGVLALMSCAPTQIHMSQHALVDGFFTFWALCCLWLLWENLQRPNRLGWLISYSLGLSLLVLTKENAFFVFIGILAILVLNRWCCFGTITPRLFASTAVGAFLGAIGLALLAGGVETLIAAYRLSVSKNLVLDYAILTGDGPWHRYLVDLLLVSPVVLLLAVGGIFRLNTRQKADIYVAVFIAATYLAMCNVKYGMNLRYANMWDMPLRFLAIGTLVSLVAPVQRYRHWLLGCLIALVCLFELRQYIILAVNFPLYELVSEGLLRALHILK